MFSQKRTHLVPDIIKNRVTSLLNEAGGRNALAEKENHAAMLEAVVEYCQIALNMYAKKSPFKHKKIA